MLKKYETTAFAKINLFLRVCGKLPNGYHRLLTLMQEIGIGDDIIVSVDDEKPYEIVIDSDLKGTAPEDDLCYKAAKRFYDKYSKNLRLNGDPEPESHFGRTEIKVNKSIPSQAGLGGGSSDAAEVLLILQHHYGDPITDDEMAQLSVGLGADVPFFLTGGSCICEGVGEDVNETGALAGLNILIIKPSEGVSTPECFRLCDSKPVKFDEEKYRKAVNEIFEDESLSAVERVVKSAPLLINDLEAPACELVPRIREIVGKVRATEPLYAAMSGSGSAVFGIYKDEESMEAAIAVLGDDSDLAGCLIFPTVTV